MWRARSARERGSEQKPIIVVSNETGDAGNRQISREQRAAFDLADAVKRKARHLISGDLRAPAARHRGVRRLFVLGVQARLVVAGPPQGGRC